MTFAIEQHDGLICLVSYDSQCSTGLVLAQFYSELASEIWTEHYDRALLMARECGRMGLG